MKLRKTTLIGSLSFVLNGLDIVDKYFSGDEGRMERFQVRSVFFVLLVKYVT